jgi:hypothetical protein
MLRIESTQIFGKTIRPAPWGTEIHELPCLVFDDRASTLARFCVVTVKNDILTAKTTKGLRRACEKAGLVWSEDFYIP